jgi:hypothetical protein
VIEIKYEINGRRVSPNNIGSALEKALLQSIGKQIQSKVGNIRDPKTGEKPKITVKGRDLNNLSFDVSGSPELIELVKRKLR